MLRKPKITLIAALGPDGLIGRAGGLVFHIPADMKYFRRMTLGKPVVMGRKTYESIPTKFRPLDGRQNIVLTKDRKWNAEGVTVINDIDQILDAAGACNEIIIAGGAEIYALTLAMADRLLITDIRDVKMSSEMPFTQHFYLNGKFNKPDINAFFPKIDYALWTELSRCPVPDSNVTADWVVYERA